MPFDPTQPYNLLPRLPPKAEVETKRTLKLCIVAHAALAELRVAGKFIPNQAILINTIPVLEAQASSEIENIVTTSDRLFQLDPDSSGATDPATKEAARYRQALYQGSKLLLERPLTTATAIALCSTIKGIEMQVRRVPGTALENQATGKIIYTPPSGESVLLDLLADWERYLHEPSDVDPLIRMAIAHYQFEAIHPFTDGNGRTGRLLNLLYLVDQQLLDLPVLYLSRAILANRADYYRLLLNVTGKHAWEAWVVYMLEAIIETARWTTAKINALYAQMQAAKAHIKRFAKSIYSHELLDVLFSYPYCRIDYLLSAGVTGRRQTASIYLKTLCRIGVLQELKIGREKIFLQANLQRLLTTEKNDVLFYNALEAATSGAY